MEARPQKSKWCDRAFVGLFLLTVFLPAGLAILPWKLSSPPLTEKRPLAKRPAIPHSIESLTAFPQKFSRFFDDHFPLRTQLIQRYNYLRVKLIKYSDQRNVLMGREGWLFYTRDKMLRDFIGKAPLSEEELGALRSLLEAKRDWLAARGIAYLFVIPPNKQTIYPEYMPENYARVRGRTRLDQFMDHMRAHSDVTIVDLRPSLLAAKSRFRLYHRHDTHWNSIGGLVGYGEIMRAVERTLARDFENVRTFQDFRPSHRTRRGGDLTDMLALNAYFIEDEPILIPNDGFRSCARKERLQNYLGRDWKPNEDPIAMHCRGADLKMVMFRDSMASRLIPFLSEHFRRSTYVSKWNYEADIFKAVVEKEQPHIVIDECGERMLGHLGTGPMHRPDY